MANRMVRRMVRALAELAVWEHGRLPNGILCDKATWGDDYTAAKELLVSAGIAQANWFPAAPVPSTKRPGTFKRQFKINTPAGEVELTDHANGKWSVRLPVSEDEHERRDAEWTKQNTEWKRKQERERMRKLDGEEAERVAQLKVTLRSLPPFAPGSMSESERHHMRVLRGLTQRRRDVVMDFAERMLDVTVADDEDEEQHSTPRKTRPSLQVVVDNT